MSTIICKIGEIKATDKGEVIVKFTSTSGAEFASIMGLMTDLVAVSIEPVRQQGELDLDDDDALDLWAVTAASAPLEPIPLALESVEVTDAEYTDVETGEVESAETTNEAD